MSYRVTRNSSGLVVKRTPPPAPSPHRGFDFSVIYATIDVSDISSGADFMELAALRNVISNNFHPLVDIFYHYARPRHPSHQESSAAAAAAANASSSGTSPTAAAILALPQEYLHHSVTMRGLSELVRACRLSDPTCSFFEIQRRSLRPNPHEGLDDSLFPSQPDDYPVPVFFEAIIRIANLKHYGLHSLCDRVNKMLAQQILPFAAGEDEADRTVKETMLRPAIASSLHNHKPGLRKFYNKRLKLESPPGRARSICLGELVDALRSSSQLDDEVTPAAVKDAMLACLTFAIPPESITEVIFQVIISALSIKCFLFALNCYLRLARKPWNALK
mmetsp:Transcript_7977/g.23987  ORF Transcript_7977/g.23987 Transcript_7977/m.23987 type:complete len:333 (+) Transcript_7977:407-1405(+)